LLAVIAVAGAAVLIAAHDVQGGVQKLFVVLGALLIVLVAVNVCFSEKWAGRILCISVSLSE
jgi:hypothetical protein